MLRRLSEWLADRRLRTKGLLIVAIPLAPFMLTSVLVFVGDQINQDVLAHIERMEEIESALVTLDTDLVEAEAGVHEYMLTGDDDNLSGQRTLRRQVSAIFARLQGLVQDAEQRLCLARLPVLVEQCLVVLDDEVNAARTSGRFPAPIDLVDFEQNEQLMAAVRDKTAAMLRRDQALLALRELRVQRIRQFLRLATGVGLAIAGVGGALAVMLFTAGVTARVRVLHTIAEHLARGAPLLPPLSGRDEMATLGEHLHQAAVLLAEREQVLRQAHETLDSFFSLSLDPLCVAGFDGYFKRLNKAWEQTLGWSEAELLARPYLDLVHPDDREATVRKASQLAHGDVVISFENRYECQDGTYRWLQWMSVPAVEEGLIYAVVRDVTVTRAMEARIRALNADLQRRTVELTALNQELEAFSYSVSHDLRAPLRSIDGFSQVLLEDYGEKLDEEGQDSLQRIRAAATRMAGLIDALLALSRVSRSDLQVARVDLSALAQTIATELHQSQPERQVDWAIAPDLVVEGDTRLLYTVLENLLGNAWKYTSGRATSRIEFGGVRQDGRLVYSVRDNGVGFDMAYVGKLFGAFQRLHPESQYGGAGVGLATVRRIIRRHGGDSWAEGAVDDGATFYFTLNDPANRDAPAARAAV